LLKKQVQAHGFNHKAPTPAWRTTPSFSRTPPNFYLEHAITAASSSGKDQGPGEDFHAPTEVLEVTGLQRAAPAGQLDRPSFLPANASVDDESVTGEDADVVVEMERSAGMVCFDEDDVVGEDLIPRTRHAGVGRSWRRDRLDGETARNGPNALS